MQFAATPRYFGELPWLGYGFGDRPRRRAESPVAPARSICLALDRPVSLGNGLRGPINARYGAGQRDLEVHAPRNRHKSATAVTV